MFYFGGGRWSFWSLVVLVVGRFGRWSFGLGLVIFCVIFIERASTVFFVFGRKKEAKREQRAPKAQA